MFHSFLSVISLTLIFSLLIFRFIAFFSSYSPLKLAEGKLFKYFGVATFSISFFLVLAFSIFPPQTENNPIKDYLKKFERDKNYFNVPEFWNPYLQFRNDLVTKIRDPFSQNETVAIYGSWTKIEETQFEIDPNFGSIKIIDTIASYTYLNEPVLKIKQYDHASQNEVMAFFHFNKKEKLEKSIYPNSQKSISYNKQGKLVEELTTSGGEIAEKLLIVYEGDNYTATTFDSDDNLIKKGFWRNDRNGIPISLEMHDGFLINKRQGIENKPFVVETTKIEISGREKTELTSNSITPAQEKRFFHKGFNLYSRDLQEHSNTYPVRYINHFKFESSENWTIKLSIENEKQTSLTLRKITYQDGTSEGFLDPKKPDVKDIYNTSSY